MKLQILGSGLGRTGTMSLKFALEELSQAPCFHMVELMKDTSRLPLLKRGAKTGHTDWSAFFAGYHSSVDYPGCLFLPEILSQNPRLKVIHTTRDPEAWYDSVARTIYRGVPQGPRDVLRLIWNAVRFKEFRRVAPVFMFNDKLIWKGQFEGKFKDKAFAIEVFQRHEAKIRSLVPNSQLLIYRIEEGWEPLCRFLQVPIPELPFPKTNQRDAFNAKMDLLFSKGEFRPYG